MSTMREINVSRACVSLQLKPVFWNCWYSLKYLRLFFFQFRKLWLSCWTIIFAFQSASVVVSWPTLHSLQHRLLLRLFTRSQMPICSRVLRHNLYDNFVDRCLWSKDVWRMWTFLSVIIFMQNADWRFCLMPLPASVFVVHHKVSGLHVSKPVWPRITRFYRDIHTDLVHSYTGYDITSYFWRLWVNFLENGSSQNNELLQPHKHATPPDMTSLAASSVGCKMQLNTE